MKTPRLLIAALVSGRVKLTPEVLDVLRKHGQDSDTDETENGEPLQSPQVPDAVPTQGGRDVSPKRPCADGNGRLGEASLPNEAEPEDSSKPDSPSACSNRRWVMFVSPLPARWVRMCGMTLSCLALWLAPPSVRGQEARFDAANQASAEGKWAEAVRGYEDVIALHGYSAHVLFNLANAQMAEGKLGPAILNYERARWLAPNDPDIAANLALARQKAGVEPESLLRFATAAHSLTWTEWSILATAMLWLLAAALPLRRILPRAVPAITAGAVVAALILLSSLGAVALRWHDLDRAIVTAPNAAARVSPVTVIQPLFALRAGEPVTIKRTHGAFLLIANGQGREGWVSRDSVTPVVNPSPAGGHSS
jgi:hypothetical protein